MYLLTLLPSSLFWELGERGWIDTRTMLLIQVTHVNALQTRDASSCQKAEVWQCICTLSISGLRYWTEACLTSVTHSIKEAEPCRQGRVQIHMYAKISFKDNSKHSYSDSIFVYILLHFDLPYHSLYIYTQINTHVSHTHICSY